MEYLQESFKTRILREMRGSDWVEPSSLTLASLRPVLKLLGDEQRKDGHFGIRPSPVGALFAVVKCANRLLGRFAVDASLLEGFARSSLVRLKPTDGVAFRDDPTSRATRGDQQYLDVAIGTDSVGERTDLLHGLL
jgi:hypothetical protein